MEHVTVVFWACGALVVFTYVGYPALARVAASLRPKLPFPNDLETREKCPISIVISARDEECAIGRRLDELIHHAESSGHPSEIIVVSDGSADATAEVARSRACRNVVVVELKQNVGKSGALSKACEVAKADVLVFADVRQRWDENAIGSLCSTLMCDASIGAVSGNLLLESAPGSPAGVDAYWKYEKWIRKAESRWYSTVGVTGAICAVRRSLFRPIPRGVVLDDVYWPLVVAMQGRRVVFEERAIAWDRLPGSSKGEFRRKVRTLAGNFQLVAALPAAVLPWRNPIWFQFVCHKLMRLVAPWALLTMLSCSLVAAPYDRWMGIAFLIQIACYAAGIAAVAVRSSSLPRVCRLCGSFLLLNAAAAAAPFVWMSGRTTRSWVKTEYR